MHTYLQAPRLSRVETKVVAGRPNGCAGEAPPLLLHTDQERIAAQTQHQSRTLGPQTQNDTMFVL